MIFCSNVNNFSHSDIEGGVIATMLISFFSAFQKYMMSKTLMFPFKEGAENILMGGVFFKGMGYQSEPPILGGLMKNLTFLWEVEANSNIFRGGTLTL